jgi:hypothetical protein
MTISYSIELHEITDLTWPMWESCGIECPAMIGGTCPREIRDQRTGGFLTCPGNSSKFTNAASEVVHSWTLDSGQSDECGNSVDGDCWFALFRNPDAGTFDGPMGAGVILCETSMGFVQATRFTTMEELTRDWAKIQAEYEDDEEI